MIIQHGSHCGNKKGKYIFHDILLQCWKTLASWKVFCVLFEARTLLGLGVGGCLVFCGLCWRKSALKWGCASCFCLRENKRDVSRERYFRAARCKWAVWLGVLMQSAPLFCVIWGECLGAGALSSHSPEVRQSRLKWHCQERGYLKHTGI